MKAVKWALLSRLVVLLLILLWSLVGSPYDTSASLNPPCLGQNSNATNPSSGFLGEAIGKSIVWDGVHYIRIAQCGYEYEQMHAFQPLLPLAMRFLANTVFCGLIPLVGYRATLALAGYLLNNIAFVIAAYYLHKLSVHVLGDEDAALRATQFFCWNPASVFYSSIYSESLFAALSFSGMWHFVCGANWKAATLFSLSCIVRSNGILHSGFFIFQALHATVHSVFRYHKVAGSIIMTSLMQVVYVVAPFIAFQAYGYYEICWQTPIQRQWCKSRIPYIYGFVQKHYWNVGFLRYFELKQLPNFIMATPMLLLSLLSIANFAKAHPKLMFTFGLAASLNQRNKPALTSSVTPVTHSIHSEEGARGLRRRIGVKEVKEFNNLSEEVCDVGVDVVPFVFQLMVMTAVAFFIMHVQVATRFLSYSPVIYWYLSTINTNNFTINFIFLSYILLGTLLFSNFYPFT